MSLETKVNLRDNEDAKKTSMIIHFFDMFSVTIWCNWEFFLSIFALNWYDQGFSVINKINQRLYFIRKWNQLHVEKTIITMFYTSTMKSIISFCLIVLVYGGNLNISEQTKINNVISKVEKITNMPVIHIKDLLLQQI